LPFIVAVHEQALAGFFLTLLGRRFLTELYRAFIIEPDGVCWVTETCVGQSNSRVVGFIAGTLKPARFYRRLLYRRGLHFAFAALPALFRHPVQVLPRLLRAVLYRGEHPEGIEGAALLSSLGVSPNVSRQGLGKELVNVFCKNAARRGVREVYLTTDQRGNEAVNMFYERAGFRLLSTYTRQDCRVMNTYLRTTGLHANDQ
jgi:GNAT superfamily N-acetyltransferase